MAAKFTVECFGFNSTFVPESFTAKQVNLGRNIDMLHISGYNLDQWIRPVNAMWLGGLWPAVVIAGEQGELVRITQSDGDMRALEAIYDCFKS